MNLDYEFGRDMRGNLKAKTVLPLGSTDRRELHIETSKRHGGGVATGAVVFQRTEDGKGLTHAFALSSFGKGDFRVTLVESRTMRCTEKAVREMHERALLQANDTLNQARGFYVAQDVSDDARKQAEIERHQLEQQVRLDNR